MRPITLGWHLATCTQGGFRQFFESEKAPAHTDPELVPFEKLLEIASANLLNKVSAWFLPPA
ncbi:hypothetical protein [Leisingera sp. M523]|uniref:hypothetical protein n=1 Tax=Leisingera sp. M523 TaxID=2867013 RepID=UPI0021A2AD6C|nr:hypothetical protein [Leisingera sp. M523]UWQ29279.1 hypothetical protein K3557_01505 [Leisingera sp. M523]